MSTSTNSNSSSLLYPSIPLEGLPLRPSTLKLFHQRGFYTTKEIDESRRHMANFAAELNLPMKDCVVLLKEVDKCLEIEVAPLPTASEILLLSSSTTNNNKNQSHHKNQQQQQQQPSSIVTFSRHIDQLLRGGIPLGHVTEIAGMPGTGKTQLAMQLCVNCAIPMDHGGVQGQALYIDSEGSFTPERVYDMAKSLVRHVQRSATKHNKPPPINWTPESILDSIRVFRVHDETSQTATLYNLPSYIIEQQQQQQQDQNSTTTSFPIKLIVLDSIAFHYRAITPTDPNYYVQRTQNLSHLASFLGDIAQTYQIAVVVINQMTTKIFHNNTNNNTQSTTSSRLVPALGESWAHSTTTRILLSDSNNNNNQSPSSSSSSSIKTLSLVKSPHLPQGNAKFQILSSGIRDPVKTVTPTKQQQQQQMQPRPLPPPTTTTMAATASSHTNNNHNQWYKQQQFNENRENNDIENKRVRRY